MNTKYVNGIKYILHHKRWIRSGNHIPLSYEIWNLNHPNDVIRRKDGFVIHHINKISNDDRTENLQKMTIFEHNSFHHLKDGRTSNKKKYSMMYSKKYMIKKNLFYIRDKDNHFTYTDSIDINKQTRTITISHSWGYYRNG